VGVRDESDLAGLIEMSLAADQIMIDAKAPEGAVLPGGNGVAFDWRLLVGRKWLRPWLLAGGLTAANVAEAVRLTGARQVDVASGVERAPGMKDPAMIAAFVRAAG
jgi:phosphoribosylanthranilate isomerase